MKTLDLKGLGPPESMAVWDADRIGGPDAIAKRFSGLLQRSDLLERVVLIVTGSCELQTIKQHLIDQLSGKWHVAKSVLLPAPRALREKDVLWMLFERQTAAKHRRAAERATYIPWMRRDVQPEER